MKFRLGSLLLGLVILCTSGCAVFPISKKPPQKQPPLASKPRAYWDEVDAPGEREIVISLSEQRALFYKGLKLVGESVISSGKDKFETPPGHYKVIQKDLDHHSNLYGDYVDANGEIVKHNVDVNKDSQPAGTTFKGAPMRYFLRFTGGYGMHAGNVPGYRASHGCVRLPRSMAQHFYENAEIGMPVTVED